MSYLACKHCRKPAEGAACGNCDRPLFEVEEGLARSRAGIIPFLLIGFAIAALILAGALIRQVLAAELPQKRVDIHILYGAIIAEASNQGYRGMYAVACVVRNRSAAGMSLGLCGARRRDIEHFIREQPETVRFNASEAVKAIFIFGQPDITGGALYFESTDFPRNIEKFDRRYIRTVKIGKHIFYVERKKKQNGGVK